MRAFGPGSVSSFLATTLDVAFVLLWIAAAVLALSVAAGLLWQPFLGPAPRQVAGPLAQAEALLRRGPLLLALAVCGGLALAALLAVVDRLRRVFAMMSAGDPFHPGSVRRLREAGAALVVLQLAAYGLQWASAAVFPELHGTGPRPNLTGWFSILVVFVLSEVFREGARLRAEAELTI